MRHEIHLTLREDSKLFVPLRENNFYMGGGGRLISFSVKLQGMAQNATFQMYVPKFPQEM